MRGHHEGAAAPTIDAPQPPPGATDAVTTDEIRTDPLGFLERRIAAHGYVSAHRSEPWDVVLAHSPTAARRVLREHRQNYVKSDTPDESMLVPLLGRGLLTTDGDAWREQRRLVQPAFRPHRVTPFDTTMVDAAASMVERWSEAARTGADVHVDRDLTALALAVVAQTILGSDIGTLGPRFGEAIDVANRFMGHYSDTFDAEEQQRDRAAFMAARRLLDMIVTLMIDGRRIERDPAAPAADVLDELLDADITAREVRDQVVTILMAGHETTAKSLTWTLWLLDRHPEVLADLEAEVDTVLGDRLPTADDAAALPLCHAVMAESMRLYPPVWLISRRALEDDVIDGHHVAAGSLVCISPWVLHRRTDLWDTPDEFRPERFLPGRDHDPFAYLPFSSGARQCIGREFALLETQLVLATIVSRVRARTCEGHVVEPEALVTLRPRHGMRMTMEARR